MAEVNGWQIGLGTLLKAPEIFRDWYGTINDVWNESNARDALGSISRFSSSREARDFDPSAVGYMNPDTMVKINDLRANKLDSLLRSEAAPVQATAERYLNMAKTDPYVGSEEGRRDFAERPQFWLGGADTGNVTGGKGTVPESSGNPYESQALQRFAGENANVLNAFRASGGDRMAGANLAVDKDLAKGFQDVSAGIENYNQERTAESARVKDAALAKYYADTPYDPAQHAAWMEGAARTGAPTKDVLDLSKHLMDRNKDRVTEYRNVRVQNGPNSTVERVGFNAYGQPVSGFSTQSTNNPSDRELGLVPGGGGGNNEMLDVSWVVNGVANAARLPRSELPTLKESLKAQGVTELATVDGKRASRTEKLIKEEKRSRRDRFAPPGGSAAPTTAAAGGGGYTYVNGKLVKN